AVRRLLDVDVVAALQRVDHEVAQALPHRRRLRVDDHEHVLGLLALGQGGDVGLCYSHPRRLKNRATPTSTANMTTMMTQNACNECSPGTLTFIPKMLAISVSGRKMRLIAVSTRKVSLVRCASADSFVASRPSTTSL